MRLISLLLLVCCVYSCKESPEKNILPPQKMQEVFWDYLKADVYTTDYIVPDSTKVAQAENIRLQQLIFEKHKVSREQFYKSYDFYLKHPGIMTTLLDSMMAVEARKHLEKPKIRDTSSKILLDTLGVE